MERKRNKEARWGGGGSLPFHTAGPGGQKGMARNGTILKWRGEGKKGVICTEGEEGSRVLQSKTGFFNSYKRKYVKLLGGKLCR